MDVAFGRTLVERDRVEKRLQILRRLVEPGEAIPLLAVADMHLLLQCRHLIDGHDAGVVVLVSFKRQSMPLDRVGDEAGWPVVLHPVETLEQRLEIVTGEVCHQPMQGVVGVLVEQVGNARHLAEVPREPVPPCLAASIGERRVGRIRTGVDPFTQLAATGLGEHRFQKLAVLEHDNLPFDRAEQVLEALREAVDHHGIETLAVVVDDPPDVSDIVFPRLEQCLEHVPFVELRVSGQRNHPPRRTAVRQSSQAEIVLHECREGRHGNAKTNRPSRKIHVGYIFGPGGIRLRAAQGTKTHQTLSSLTTKEILNRVKDRTCVRLHGDTVVRT